MNALHRDGETNDTPLPDLGRLAGVDFGTVRVGLALSDPSQNWVTPVDTYTRSHEKRDLQFFRGFADSEQLVGWVVGLPIHCDGNESHKSQEARQFAAWLSECSNLPHVLYDERFSTREARRLLQDTGLSSQQKKKRLDRLAAHVILTHFLENRQSVYQNDALDADNPAPQRGLSSS